MPTPDPTTATAYRCRECELETPSVLRINAHRDRTGHGYTVHPPAHTIHYGRNTTKHVAHAYRSQFGGPSLCGLSKAHFDDRLTAVRPARLCTRCTRLLAAQEPDGP